LILTLSLGQDEDISNPLEINLEMKPWDGSGWFSSGPEQKTMATPQV